MKLGTHGLTKEIGEIARINGMKTSNVRLTILSLVVLMRAMRRVNDNSEPRRTVQVNVNVELLGGDKNANAKGPGEEWEEASRNLIDRVNEGSRR